MEKMKAKILDRSTNPNIGLFCHINDDFALVSAELKDDLIKDIETILGVKVIPITIMGIDLCGVMCSYDQFSKKLYVPKMILKHEKDILEENDIEFIEINSKYNTIGNNIVISEKNVLINSNMEEKDLKEYEKKVGKKLIRIDSEFESVGQVLNIINNKALLGYILEEKKEEIEKKMNVEIIVSSINNGSPYIKSGLLINKKGFLVHEASSSIELSNIEEIYEE